MLRLIHRIVSNPWIYDLSQVIAGRRTTRRALAACLPTARRDQFVLDLGGGTGAYRMLWPEDGQFICLDLEMPKLHGFRARYPADHALLADGTRLPLPDHCMDVVQMIFVAHHLTDPQLDAALEESRRVLKPDGHLVLMDPLWVPRRLRGRLLWALDRGSYPRTDDALRAHIALHFNISFVYALSIHHAYGIYIGVPRGE